MEQRELLSISHMKKSFGQLEVIKDFSLHVREGEVVSIIGPSGSGKSTILRCASLLEFMDDGELSYLGEFAARSENGKSVYVPKNELRKLHRHFGLVFQNFNLFPHYSVLKNITEPMLLEGSISAQEAQKKGMELLERLGLSDKASAFPYQLSGGQQQRVSIARALGLSPQILFFDEPTSALDPELTTEVLKVIRALAEEKMTMVIVTHEMSFARDLSDRIIFMEKGVVAASGTPQEVFSSDNARVREFIGKVAQSATS